MMTYDELLERVCDRQAERMAFLFGHMPHLPSTPKPTLAAAVEGRG
jgi:hypothetical protein